MEKNLSKIIINDTETFWLFYGRSFSTARTEKKWFSFTFLFHWQWSTSIFIWYFFCFLWPWDDLSIYESFIHYLVSEEHLSSGLEFCIFGSNRGRSCPIVVNLLKSFLCTTLFYKTPYWTHLSPQAFSQCCDIKIMTNPDTHTHTKWWPFLIEVFKLSHMLWLFFFSLRPIFRYRWQKEIKWVFRLRKFFSILSMRPAQVKWTIIYFHHCHFLWHTHTAV